MESLETNKLVAAVLVAGIVFSVGGVLGGFVVNPTELKKPVLDIKVAPESGGPAPSAPKALPPIAPLLVSADPSAGEADTKKLCVSCHNFNEGGANKVGPDLYGVVGRDVASHPGFDYSGALKKHSGPWTFAELNEWLHSPRDYAPGTKMSFGGIENDKERANVIDYLRTLSPKPEPLPAADATPPAATPAAAGANAAAAAPAAGKPAEAPANGSAPASGVLRPQVSPMNGAAGQGGAHGQSENQPSANQNIPQALQSEGEQSPLAKPAGPAHDVVPAAQQAGHPVASPTAPSMESAIGVPDAHAPNPTPQARTDGNTTQDSDRSQGTNGGATGK